MAQLGIFNGIYNLHTLAHSRCKQHSAIKCHTVGEDVSADKNCVCVNKRSILIER